MQHQTYRIFSMFSYTEMIFSISTQDGTKHNYGNRKPHREYLARATCMFFSLTLDTLPKHMRWLKYELYCALSFLKVTPSHPCFTAPCLMHSCPQSSLHFFPTLAPSPMTTPSLLHPSTSSSPATPPGGLCFDRLAKQSPLTGYEVKTLIEVSSEHTPINIPSRERSLDSDLKDLATTVDK